MNCGECPAQSIMGILPMTLFNHIGICSPCFDDGERWPVLGKMPKLPWVAHELRELLVAAHNLLFANARVHEAVEKIY
jgi:hypothetical protein